MKLAIISARKLYRYVLSTLKQHPEKHIEPVCFADWRTPTSDSFQDIPVIPLQDLGKFSFDAVLLTVNNPHRVNEILLKLHNGPGVEKPVYIERFFPIDRRVDFLCGSGFDPEYVDSVQPGTTYMAHAEALVCDHCNLNCKSCGAFSPFVNGKRVTDIRAFSADMERVARLYDCIGHFNLLGGEPLLEWKRALEMVRVVREYYPRCDLRILTNGILVPSMPSEYWDAVKRYGVTTLVTVYPAVAPRLPEIETVLNHNHAAYVVAEVNTFGKYLQLEKSGNAAFNNDQCMCSGCHFVREGHLAKCGTAWLLGNIAPAIGCDPETYRTQDAVDLYESGLDAWEVLRRVTRPADICAQCSWSRIESRPWEPVRHFPPDPSDWLLDPPEQDTAQETMKVPENLIPEGHHYATFRKLKETGASGKPS